MKGIKKTLCLLLSLVMILSMGVPAFALDKSTSEAQANTTSSETSPFSIELSTDKSSYSATGIAKITAKVTNTSGKDIKNVSAEAVFTDLAPVKNGQTTAEAAETLKDGESLEFTYRATINKDVKKLNIIEKIILFFVRIFNGGYSAKDNGFDNGREFVESSSDIKFGKHTAVNGVKVWFGESGKAPEEPSRNEISDEDFNAFQNIRKSIESLSNKEAVINILEDETEKGNIKDYHIFDNYITFETILGIRGIWEDKSLFNNENKSVSLDNKSNVATDMPLEHVYENITNQAPNSAISRSWDDVAVIRPYRSTDFQYDDFLTVGETIATAIGVETDVFDNANATLSVLENLDDYSIILIDSHGSLIENEPYICLTQTFNNQEVSLSDLDSIFINQNNQIRVNSNFFENNYDNTFGDCLVFLGTCYGMFNDSISNSLINNGVDCVYGYTDTVSVGYCNKTLTESIVKNLFLNRATSMVAYDNTVSICGQTDPYNEYTHFVTQQSNDFYLSIASGDCGENATWVLYANNELVISGNGYMTSYASSTNTPWNENTDRILSVTVESNISSVGQLAFSNLINLCKVTIADSVNEIGEFAFNNCASLEEITIKNPNCEIFDQEDTINDTATIYGYNCSTAEKYANKYNRTFISIGDSDEHQDIPSTAVEFNGNYYQVYDNSMTWTEAKEYCENLGGHLATITTAEEQAFVESIINYGTKSYYWLGGTDENVEGDWTWVTGERFSYTHWGEDMPDNYQTENYLMIFKEDHPSKAGNTFGYWNDLKNDCTCKGTPFFRKEGFGFICEWESESNDNKQCLTDMPITSFDRYTGNQGDSCVYHLDKSGLIGTSDTKYYRNGNVGIDGTEYNHGLEVWLARWNFTNEISWAYAVYELNGNFKKLTGKTGLIRGSTNTSNFDTTVYFYDGETLLQSYNLTNSDYNKEIDVDLTGVDELKVLVKDNVAVKGGTSFALYDMFLK